MKDKYKFKISVIVPIYNVYEYLEECIQSIIKQTIGFKNIQLILVNDGSPDNSEEICLKYKDKYPNNVVYVKKENGGVSSARNEGMKYIEGKYVHFLDSDDAYGKTGYKKAYTMLESDPSIDVCSLRIKFFDSINSYHYLDYKFAKGDRVVDLSKEPNNPVLHISSAVIRSEVAKANKFDSKIKMGEDFKYLAEIIMKKAKLGLIASENYYYRRRKDESSAVQTSKSKRDYYLVTPKYVYEHLLTLSKKYPKAHKWMQYCIVSDMRFRLIKVNFSCLNKEEEEEYKNEIRKIYHMCDDEVITTQFEKDSFVSCKYRALEYKYNKPIYSDIKIDDKYVKLYGKKILPLEELIVKLSVFEIKGHKLNITACFDIFLNNNYDMYIKEGNNYHKFRKLMKKEPINNLYSQNGDYYKSYFDIEFDLSNVKSFELCIKINNKYYVLKPLYQYFSKFNNLPHCYYSRNGFTITHKQNTFFVNEKVHFKFVKYLKDILLIKKDILVFGMLVIYKLTYPFVKHNNWILSDRFDVAGDNGEFFFKYLRQNLKKKNIYFGLKKKSKDANKMKNVGKILYFNTVNYFIKYLNSELVISSHIDDFIRRPFGTRSTFINMFMHNKFVFLQHGVTKNDMSNWLCKPNKNIDILVCSSDIEYNEFLRDEYLYDESVVKLTGMPRYDNLLSNDFKEENLIALMPTWRTSLCGPQIILTQNREYNPDFKNSEYYKFYNGLVTDKRFVECLKRNKCKVLFCLHPAFVNQLKDFENTKYVEFKTEVFYPDVFKRAKLMLTDYSSVAFDFGYTKKPIVYSQYDKDHLYQIHTVLTDDGEFSYENDGFGKVTYNYEDALNEMIRIIDSGFKNDEKYIKRVNKFFKYHDDKNCERLYNEIVKLLDSDKQ